MTEKWVRTHCARFDHGGCGLKVLVENGRARRVRPDADDAFSGGYACAKGMATIERLDHPLRLVHPLRRSGARGSGLWQRISWDAALDLLTEQFQTIRDRLGPEALAFAQGAPKGLEFFMLLRLANLLQTPNVGGTQHVCHMPREQMAMLTCGFFPVADFAGTPACVLLWGSNPAATNEEGVLGGHVMECLKRGPKLIVVDPLRTDVARRADLWLQIRPGTDDFLALGFLHLLIEEQLFDADFVAQWTVGFESLREAVRDYTPEHVSQATWVPRAQIEAAARLYGRSRPALLHWGNAVEHTSNSAQVCRALVLLMAVSGNLEAPGGNIRAQAPRLQRLSEFLRLDRFPDRPRKLINHHHRIMPRLLTVPGSLLIRCIREQSPYPIRALYVQGTNPLLSYAQAGQVREALMSLEFLAVAEQVMTPTAALADLVLPAATNLEFNDIGHYGLPHGYVLARPQVVVPHGECWPDIKILNAWGQRLGFTEHFWDDVDQALDEILAPSGITYQEFVAQGMLRGKKVYHSYRDKGFGTPSGKVELHSSLLEKWGYRPLPHAHETPAMSAAYPLLLTSRKPRWFFHSAWRHLDSLRKRTPQPELLIHPETAQMLGINNGDRVRISTATGSIHQIARLSDDIDPRVVVADYGWWFPERDTSDLYGGMEANINCLTRTDNGADPIMGTPQMRALPCRIERAEPV